MIPITYTTDVLKAVGVATQGHWGQTRADRKTPYVLHPLRVATLVETAPLPEGVSRRDVVLAAILHDVLEDSGTGRGSTVISKMQLAENFGYKVADVVEELTQDKTLAKADRRAKMIEHCATMSIEAKIIKLADRLDNMRDMKHMPADFVTRYCDEARQMVANMKGACSPFEVEIQNIMANYDK
jgi:(p)ppGpp synthase/HD superfamily hydrolase